MNQGKSLKSRILLTDGLFPNQFSSWRNVEILSFIQEFDTTVLVKHGKSWAGIDFEIDPSRPEYEENLSGYSFLIFDQNFNYLNNFNCGFDGTVFNGSIPTYSYAFTKDKNFNIFNFDHYYHIFLGSYHEFNSNFRIPSTKQTIHLYPGGGYTHGLNLDLPDSVGAISTFPTTSDKLRKLGIAHVDCWSVPLFMKKEKIIKRGLRKGNLRVCFASLGSGSEKGDKTFRWIARIMSTLFVNFRIEFISVGNCVNSRYIRNIPPMSWKQLESFYTEETDVYLNPVSKRATNGWPIGQEAMKNGCVIVTYDVNNVAEDFQAKKYRIQIVKGFFGMIRKLIQFHFNRELLRQVSISNQKFVESYAGFANQQEVIFRFIRERMLTPHEK